MGSSEQTVPGLVTPEQHAAFGRDGFIVVPGLFADAEMAAVRDWVDTVQSWEEVPGKYMMYFEESGTGERLLNRLEDFAPYHPGLHGLMLDDRLQGVVGELFGEPATLFKDKINFKLPGGEGFAAHQDVQAGWAKYASVHLTALVSIDAMTRENGCLEIAPRLAPRLMGHEWEPLSEDELADVEFRPILTRPGDAVFFDSFVPHRSAANTSEASRRVLYATYNKAAEGDVRRRYYVDKRAGYPPDIERVAGREYRYKV